MLGRQSYFMLRIPIVATLLLLTFGLLAGCRGDKTGGRPGGGTRRAVVPSCPLDGLPAPTAATARRPLAVLIENSPQARPQSGLDKACVVYEAITEGGITRFMAVYLHQDAAIVGPVRSVRPHFINLSREYAAALVHCGQSYEALQILATDTSIYNLDQMKYPKPFWRDRTRRMPHNLYTATTKLRILMTERGWEGEVSPLPRFASANSVEPNMAAPEVTLNFGGLVGYKLRLRYDAAKGGYQRYMDGKLHVDKVSGQALVARNVIIQRVRAEQFAGSKYGTYDVTVTGNGPGYLLVDGKRIETRWSKPTYRDITIFTDVDGKPLPLQPGQTWVEIIAADGSVSFTPASTQ